MIRTAKYVVILLVIGCVLAVTINLMNSGAAGITRANEEFRAVAMKLAIGRLLLIGGVILLAWEFVSKAIATYFRVEVTPLKYRILCWYIAAEAVIILSLLGMQ